MSDSDLLADWVRAAGRVAVLSGAGLSTESGIPDYRGSTGAARPATPMTVQVFRGSEAAQQRYWSRSHLGWRTIARARPNDGHRAVASLQQLGRLTGTITQNVDGLHQAAGATGVLELHGNLDRVLCLRCGEVSSREALDVRLREANPHWQGRVGSIKPDGDVEIEAAGPGSPAGDVPEAGFHIVACQICAGMLKPDVVFFGETVPPHRVAACFETVEQAGGLLVLGSSLTVMSGYRFVLRASKLGIPVAIVNQGPTRGDGHAGLRLDAPLGQVLQAATQRLGGPPSPVSHGTRTVQSQA